METEEQRKARLERELKMPDLYVIQEMIDSLWEVEIKVKEKIPTVTGKIQKIKI